MISIEQHCRYEATVRIRSGPNMPPVRVEALRYNGLRAVFRAGWPIEDEDAKMLPHYAGEWAMITPQGWRIPWIASGDLTDMRPIGPAPTYDGERVAA